MSEETAAKPSVLIRIIRVIAVLGLIAAAGYFFVLRPNMIQLQMKSKRAELPVIVKSIKMAMQYYKEETGKYISIEAYPKKTSTTPQEWVEAESGGFATIGLVPDFYQYGSYWVEATEDDFTVYGISDIDGDGVYATYKATKSENPKAVNEDVF